jgi:tetraacyldisaccharide 4'-kinase
VSLWDLVTARVLRAGRAVQPTAADRLLQCLLGVPATAYGSVVRIRNFGYNIRLLPIHRVPCRVVSIGNLTAGGTGKTPMTMTLARAAATAGLRPVVLLRGYRGAGQGARIVSDGGRVLLDWQDAGDESVLLARSLPGVPVVAGGDRVASGRLAVARFRPDLLLLDDGFQHRRIFRDRDLVLLDATDLFGGGWMLPRGRLREPAAGLRRAHAVVVTQADQAAEPAAIRRRIEALAPGVPVGWARYRVAGLRDLGGAERPLEALRGRPVLALSGIAHPERFHRTLAGTGAIPARVLAYPDHHPFSEADLAAVQTIARACGAEWIVTTDKDAIRLEGRLSPEIPVVALRVELVLEAGVESVAGALGMSGIDNG